MSLSKLVWTQTKEKFHWTGGERSADAIVGVSIRFAGGRLDTDVAHVDGRSN